MTFKKLYLLTILVCAFIFIDPFENTNKQLINLKKLFCFRLFFENFKF